MHFCALYSLKYFLKVKTFVVYLQQNNWFWKICIIKVCVKFYTSTIYMLKLTRKLLIYLKSFYFVLWLIIIWKLRCYDKNKNHDNRANNFMRNNWDNRVKEIYEETNYIAYYKFYSLCTMPISILLFYFCTLE